MHLFEFELLKNVLFCWGYFASFYWQYDLWVYNLINNQTWLQNKVIRVLNNLNGLCHHFKCFSDSRVLFVFNSVRLYFSCLFLILGIFLYILKKCNERLSNSKIWSLVFWPFWRFCCLKVNCVSLTFFALVYFPFKHFLGVHTFLINILSGILCLCLN